MQLHPKLNTTTIFNFYLQPKPYKTDRIFFNLIEPIAFVCLCRRCLPQNDGTRDERWWGWKDAL